MIAFLIKQNELLIEECGRLRDQIDDLNEMHDDIVSALKKRIQDLESTRPIYR